MQEQSIVVKKNNAAAQTNNKNEATVIKDLLVKFGGKHPNMMTYNNEYYESEKGQIADF